MDWSLFMDTQLGTGECDLLCWMKLYFTHTHTQTHTHTHTQTHTQTHTHIVTGVLGLCYTHAPACPGVNQIGDRSLLASPLLTAHLKWLRHSRPLGYIPAQRGHWTRGTGQT